MIKIGIYGYGNLGKGVQKAINAAEDAELFGIFTRRDPKSVSPELPARIFPASDILLYKNDIDVLIVCGGSATDLPEMTPALSENFNVVDSFDTHAKIPAHFGAVDEKARSGLKTALISGGWDPGLFSLARLYGTAVLPGANVYTFWGRGVSQGHSDAIRRIPGVKDARQYTVPVQDAVTRVRKGENPTLSVRDKHTRECFVVPEEGADLLKIETAIKTMPNYFADYNTTVTFITEEELLKNHSGLPHGGSVIVSGTTGLSAENRETVEFSLSLDSNPEFTSSVLLALARAVKKMNDRKEYGAKTVFDVRPADLSPLSEEELREKYL